MFLYLSNIFLFVFLCYTVGEFQICFIQEFFTCSFDQARSKIINFLNQKKFKKQKCKFCVCITQLSWHRKALMIKVLHLSSVVFKSLCDLLNISLSFILWKSASPKAR
jgi:hypothetical protein